MLVRIAVLEKKEYAEKVMQRKKGSAQRRHVGFAVNTTHALYEPLRDFLLRTIAMSPDELTRLIRKAGHVRLIVASGFFMQRWDQQLDILIVGDKLDEETLALAIRTYETEVGRELSYTCLSTEEYYYRTSIHDRLVRDVFDYPHRVLLDKIGISL